MKIVIFVEELNNWSLHNRAKAIQKFIPDHDIVIRAAYYNLECVNDHGNFDLVHFNFTCGVTNYYDFILEHKDKVLLTLVNERSLLEGYCVEQAKLKDLVEICPYVTSVSQRLAEEYGHPYIPNGIDLDIFDSYKKPIVGFAGAYRENKGVDLLETVCEDLGFELKTAKYNHGKPDISHADMKHFYRSLDAYVHASLTEGFNNTIIEALACNVPVIMTKQGCWQEFVGWVEFFEPTVEDLTRALQKYCGRKLILSRFTWPNIVAQYRDIYEGMYANLTRTRELSSDHERSLQTDGDTSETTGEEGKPNL